MSEIKKEYEVADTDHTDSESEAVVATAVAAPTTNNFVDVEKNEHVVYKADDEDVKPRMCCFCFCDHRRAAITFAVIGIVATAILMLVSIIAATVSSTLLVNSDPCETANFDDDYRTDDNWLGFRESVKQKCQGEDSSAIAQVMALGVGLFFGLIALGHCCGVGFFTLMCCGAKKYDTCMLGWVIALVVIHMCFMIFFVVAVMSEYTMNDSHGPILAGLIIAVLAAYGCFLHPTVGLLRDLKSERVSKETYTNRCCGN